MCGNVIRGANQRLLPTWFPKVIRTWCRRIDDKASCALISLLNLKGYIFWTAVDHGVDIDISMGSAA
jgi:hypothetical protein